MCYNFVLLFYPVSLHYSCVVYFVWSYKNDIIEFMNKYKIFSPTHINFPLWRENV